MGTWLACFYICGKAINLKSTASNKTLSVVWCLLWAFLFYIELPTFVLGTLFCVTSITYAWIITKIKLDTIITAFLLSYGMSLACYSISALLIGLTFAPFLSVDLSDDSLVDFNQPIYLLFYTFIALLQLFIAYIFFKIRRFKMGFPFLSGRYTAVAALFIAGTILAINLMVTAQRETNNTYHIVLPLAFSVVIAGVGIYIWIRRSIKMWQRKKAWERNEELYLQENAELTRELEHYKKMHEDIRAANHKMMHRQAATERSILRMMEKIRDFGVPAEFSDELALMMNDVRKLSKEYQDSVDSGSSAKKLPTTNIRTVDELFALFAERFAKSKIDFSLKVNGSIVYMTENVIMQSKLETMIGDHLQDALTAVDASDGNIRSVLSMIGEADGCYEFSVQDSGIPFEVNTLTWLGAERVTTRADKGGGGIGFMTTFEVMRECGASLIIKENAPGSSFSKVVTIRFDGMNRYIIDTYRTGDFPSSDRYIVR
jgi:hypothetical protein